VYFQVYDYEGYQPNHGDAGLPPDASCDRNDPGPHCGRGTFDASPPARDFAGYYMQAFKTVAQRAAPAAIMCAYNAIYGVPACASPINNGIVRDEWGWDGMFISDCGAISGIEGSHNYTHNPNETIAAALNQGGVDVNCGSGAVYYPTHMCDAVAAGSINMTDVDRAARRYWRTMMRLGMFDPMENQPMVVGVGAKDVDSPDARALAQKVAVESIVLSKNDGILPLDGLGGRLSAKTAKVAFIGPAANMTQDLLSAPQYHGQNHLVDTHSPIMVAERLGWHVSYAKGCNICDIVPRGYPNQPCSVGVDGSSKPQPTPDTSGIDAAVAIAKSSDVALLFLGSDQTTEAENFDREQIGLVGAQEHSRWP
jgi:beta-D-xylosidase 4